MAQTRSPEGVGERSLFAPDAAPFDFRPAGSPGASLPSVEPTALRPASEPPGTVPARLEAPGALDRWLPRMRGIWRVRPPPSPAMRRALELAIATELDRGIAFLLVPVLLAVGALLYFSMVAEPGWIALAAGFVLLAACAFASRARPALHMAFVAALLCVGGVVLAKAESWRAGTKMIGGEITTRLSGRVVEVERMANGRVRLTIDVTATERPVCATRRSACACPRAASPTASNRAPPSRGWSASCRPRGRSGQAATIFPSRAISTASAPAASSCADRNRLLAPARRLRSQHSTLRSNAPASSIADRISASIGGAEGEIAAALVVGVRAGIPEDVNEALRRAGIYHIISISGLHMALVAGTIMGLLRARLRAVSRLFVAPSGQEVRRRARPRRPCRLSLHVGRRGRGAAQLHHDRRHAGGGPLRPLRADHAQPRHLRDHRHRRVAARGRRPELPDVVCGDRGAGRRLCGLERLARRSCASAAAEPLAAAIGCSAWPRSAPWGLPSTSHHRGRRDGHLRRLAFPADAVARAVHQPDGHADRLDDRHALRRARRTRHAVRPRRAVLPGHGPWAFGDDRRLRAGLPSVRRSTRSASCRRRRSLFSPWRWLSPQSASTWLRIAAVPIALVGLSS